MKLKALVRTETEIKLVSKSLGLVISFSPDRAKWHYKTASLHSRINLESWASVSFCNTTSVDVIRESKNTESQGYCVTHNPTVWHNAILRVQTSQMKVTSRDPSAVLPFASLELRWRLSVRDCSSLPATRINQLSCSTKTWSPATSILHKHSREFRIFCLMNKYYYKHRTTVLKLWVRNC